MDFLKNSQNNILVCVPAYNAANGLLGTLKSILGQTYRQFDIVIIDNRSGDDTALIAQNFKREFDVDGKVHIAVNPENIGRIGNWNKCLEIFKQTNHSYLKFVFAGDTLESN